MGRGWLDGATLGSAKAPVANRRSDGARYPGPRQHERQNEEHGHPAGDGNAEAEVMRRSGKFSRDPLSGHRPYDGTQPRSLRYRSAGMTSRAKARMVGTKSSGRLPK